jgi:carboxypeptidase family protein
MAQFDLKSWLSLLFLISVAIATAKAVSDPAGSVAGTVVDADKKGVEQVEVSIYAAADTKTAIATTETAADGTFTLKDVPPGKDYVVKAVKRKSRLGLRAEQKDVAVEPGKSSDVGTLELKIPAKK